MNATGTIGSLANQRYEVNKHILRYLEVIHNSNPSPETVQWKEGVPEKPIGNNFAKGKHQIEQINRRNEALSNRLFSIMHEQREERSYEYAPGWRAGLDGAVIDCYPSEPHKATLKRFEHNSQQMRILNHKKVEEENKNILKYIEAQKTSYSADKMNKDYLETRRLFRIFANRTSPSEMHLGLIAKAKKDKERKERRVRAFLAKSQKLNNRSSHGRPRSTSPSRYSPMDSGAVAGAAVDRLVNDPSTSLELHPPRPSTAGPASAPSMSSSAQRKGSKNKSASTSKTAQRLHSAVERISSVESFIDAQIAVVNNEIRSNSEGGWNSSTNDNVLNSQHNNKGLTERPHSAYDHRREFSPAYKKVVETTSKEKSRPKSASATLPSPDCLGLESSARTSKKYVEVSSPPGKKNPFTIFDAKEKVNVSINYPRGSFRGNGDLIDFQALAIEQSVKAGQSQARNSSMSPKKPKEVFPSVENGPDWVHFPVSETLSRTYSEKDGLKSPIRSPVSRSGVGGTVVSSGAVRRVSSNGNNSKKKIPSAKKMVSFSGEEQQDDAAKFVTGGFEGVGIVPRQGRDSSKSRAANQSTVEAEARSPTHALSPKSPSSPSSRLLNQRPQFVVDADAATQREEEVVPNDSALPDNPQEQMPEPAEVMTDAATEAELRAIENLDDVEDGLGKLDEKLGVFQSQSSASSLEAAGDPNHSFKALEIRSFSGLGTRSYNIFQHLEATPKLVGYSFDEENGRVADFGIAEAFEIAVYDVGYILPCSNNTLQFSAEFSKDNAEVIPIEHRVKLKSTSKRRLSTAKSIAQLLELEEEDPSIFLQAVTESGKVSRIGSSGKFSKEEALTPVAPEPTYMHATYGILIEATAQQPRSRQCDDTTPRATFEIDGTKQLYQNSSKTNKNSISPSLATVEKNITTPKGQFNEVHKYQRTPRTYAYKLIPLKELYEVSQKVNNEEMTSLIGEMLSFAYRFGDANNHRASSPELLARRQCQSQSQLHREDPDIIFFDDRKEVRICPSLQNMLDRHSRRALTHLIKYHVEVQFDTDEELMNIAFKL